MAHFYCLVHERLAKKTNSVAIARCLVHFNTISNKTTGCAKSHHLQNGGEGGERAKAAAAAAAPASVKNVEIDLLQVCWMDAKEDKH